MNTGTVKIDTTPPTVTIAAPADGATYLLNAAVNANYSCVDPAPASGLPATGGCAGPIASGANLSTSTVGQKTFAVTAIDNAGNTTTRTNTYYVVYSFTLTPPKTPATLGSAVPLIWQLKDANGVALSDLTSLVKLYSYFKPGVQPVNGVCPVIDPASPGTTSVVLYSPATGATGGSNFRTVSGGFQFNWDTTTAQATGKGCYTLVWQLKDNSGPGPAFDVLNPSLLRKASVQLK